MVCQHCHRDIGHHPRCPLYVPPKAYHYCSACCQGIYSGEEYIVNDEGEYRHYDCFYGERDLLDWLGYEIKTMEDDMNYD